MRYTIDRFEDDFAVVELENGGMANVPRMVLPAEAKEGDVVCVDVDADGTAQKKREIEGRLDRLFQK